jgi:Protein of unknown function (DUF2946)
MVERITASPRRFGAWLALLALALQFGLSIGHFHKIGWGRVAGLSLERLIPGPADDRSPARNPTAPAEDQCPICFGLAVSGTFIFSAALPVILPPVAEAIRPDAVIEIVDLPRRPFSPAQPRAPPPVAIPA